jgi:hypothetical protein
LLQVYCIGEYCAADHASGYTPEVIAQFFDILEVVTYEICGMAQSEEEDIPIHPKIFTLLMSAMAKVSRQGCG